MNTISKARLLACAFALLLGSGCEREVVVQDAAPIGMSPSSPFGASGLGGIAGIAWLGGVGGVGVAGSAGAAGFGLPEGGAAGMVDNTAGTSAGQAGSDEPTPSPSGLLANVLQAQPGASTVLGDFIVLNDELRSIERPAIGTDGVSLVQYRSSGSASTLHVMWTRADEPWHASSGAFRAYNAAYLDHHLSLLHADAYGIYANGGDDELSGTPATYKEFIAASSQGFAWVDYPDPVNRGAPGVEPSYGEIVLQAWDGSRRVLSDKRRYRASVALSGTHIAFIEYASTEPGAFGQVVVQDLAGGAPFVAIPSTLHQDRPALDGDWLVFEEYPGGSDAVIRAYDIATGEARTLSSSVGFRTNADVLGTRVVWEDQQSGRGDIHFVDLAGDAAEQPIVSGAGHSATPRLTADGLVWLESQGNTTALVRARWKAQP